MSFSHVSSLLFEPLPFAPLRFSNASLLIVFDHFLPVRLSPSSGAAFADGPGGAAPVPGGGFPPGRSSSSSSSVSSISSSSSSSSSPSSSSSSSSSTSSSGRFFNPRLFFDRFPRPRLVVVGLLRVLAFLRYLYFEHYKKWRMSHVFSTDQRENVFPHIFISRKNTTGARVVNHGRKRVVNKTLFSR